MPTDRGESDHDLLQLLAAISHIDLSQLDVATVAIQLGAILQPQFPHDFIDVTWWSVDDQELYLSEHTVKSHISNIFQKLGVADRAGAVSVALRRNIYKR